MAQNRSSHDTDAADDEGAPVARMGKKAIAAAPIDPSKGQNALTGFDSRTLRDAYGHFPTGVTVITAFDEDGSNLGATVSSFNAVSLDPPLILWCLANNSKALPSWKRVKEFAVNMLSQNQRDISTSFSRALEDKWRDIDAKRATIVDAPLLPDTLACLECAVEEKHAGGDHLIFIGRVKCIHMRHESSPGPLLFYKGRYRQIDMSARLATGFDEDRFIHGW